MNEKKFNGPRTSNSDGKNTLSEEFLLYEYKVVLCTRKYPHDWAQCPCGHKGERAARRDPKLGYLAIACSYAKQRLPCPQGDHCPHAHNLFEYWLHPQRYRTELCQYGSNCERPVCFFAHNLDEIRPLDPTLPPAETCWSAGAAVAKTTQPMQRAGSSNSSKTASPTPPQQRPLCMEPTSSMLQQQWQPQAAAVSASMQFVQQLQQPQRQVYVQVPEGSAVWVAPPTSSTASQAIIMQQQQQPEQFVLVHTNQGLATMQQPQQVPVNVLTVPHGVVATSSSSNLTTSNMMPAYNTLPLSSAVWPQPQLQQLDIAQYSSSCFVNSTPAAAATVDAMSDCSSWSTASIADLPCGVLPLSSQAAGAAAAATSQGLALPIHVAAAAVSAQASGSNPDSPGATAITAAGLYDDKPWSNNPGMGLAPVTMQSSGSHSSLTNLGLAIGQQYDIVLPSMRPGQAAVVQPLGAASGGSFHAAGQLNASGMAASTAAMISTAFQGLQLQQQR